MVMVLVYIGTQLKWDLSTADTIGTSYFVCYMEVSTIQGVQSSSA